MYFLDILNVSYVLRRLSKTIFSRTFACCQKQIVRTLNIFIDWFNARSAPNLKIASVILNHVIYSPKMNTNNGCKSTLEKKNMFKLAVVTVSIDGLVPVDQLGHWWETMGPVVRDRYLDAWWCQNRETPSALLCEGNPPMYSPHKEPVTRTSDISFGISRTKHWDRQSNGWWCKTPPRSLQWIEVMDWRSYSCENCILPIVIILSFNQTRRALSK